jgi:hypothetical protein
MFYNVIDDEKQARMERWGGNVAILFIVLGGYLLFRNWKKE